METGEDTCKYGFMFVAPSSRKKHVQRYVDYRKHGLIGRIRNKVLGVILSTSLGALLLLSVTGMVSIFNMRSISIKHNYQLGNTAAENSQEALKSQVWEQLMSLAQDKAALSDEKLSAIQNQTKMLADMATNIYTYKNQYTPRLIDYLHPDQVGTTVPHIRSAEGVPFAAIQNEVYLAANVVDMLRQITVADMGITTSYVGGEAGYFIDVEQAAPGPAFRTDYDPRSRAWYIEAKAKDGLTWSDIFADASGRGASISCAMPFYDNSNGGHIFKGVAANGTVLSENVSKIIDSTKIGKTGYAFLLNETGYVIVTPGNIGLVADETGNIIGEDYSQSDNLDIRELAYRMVHKERGLQELEMDGKAVYVAYHPLSAIDWSLGVVVPINEVIAPAILIRQGILSLTQTAIAGIDHTMVTILLIVVMIIVSAVLITIFLAIRLSNSLTAPITALTEGAKIIGSGDLNYQLVVKTGDEIEMLAETFNQMIGNIKHITAERERIGTELNVATQIQASMLPCIFPDRKEFDIYAEMHPAKEVGGDFYDFFLIDENRLAVVIADVSGKGVPAALFMVITKTLLKNHAQMGKPLNEVFYTVNNQLCENNEASMFVTTFMGVLEINTGKFSYVNGGHNPPVIRQGDSAFTWLKTKPGLVLASIENMQFKVMETTLAENDVLFLYTDGVNEAMNTEEEFFGNQRILDVLNAENVKNSTIRDYIKVMLDDINTFANGADQADDITMLMLQCKRLA
jgi:sigma-B regulation protein RsbU (phosphoserine phosphatase)